MGLVTNFIPNVNVPRTDCHETDDKIRIDSNFRIQVTANNFYANLLVLIYKPINFIVILRRGFSWLPIMVNLICITLTLYQLI